MLNNGGTRSRLVTLQPAEIHASSAISPASRDDLPKRSPVCLVLSGLKASLD